MQPESKITRFPAMPMAQPVTTRPQPLSVATRIEIVSNVIAGVLHNAYATQHNQPGVPLAHLQPAVQRVYEGLARLSVVSLLDDEAVKAAEQQAIGHAMTILGDYMDEDEDDGIPSDIWQHRITTATRAAIGTYVTRLMEIRR